MAMQRENWVTVISAGGSIGGGAENCLSQFSVEEAWVHRVAMVTGPGQK